MPKKNSKWNSIGWRREANLVVMFCLVTGYLPLVPVSRECKGERQRERIKKEWVRERWEGKEEQIGKREWMNWRVVVSKWPGVEW